jgi:hypothetical protein
MPLWDQLNQYRHETKNQLQLPLVKFSSVQKGVTYALKKIFNKLPLNTSKLHTDSIYFQFALRKFLVKNDFYTIDEFLSINCDVN